MEMTEFIKIIIPILGIVFGVFIKSSKNENFSTVKKYWWVFVLIGIILFVIRFANYVLFG